MMRSCHHLVRAQLQDDGHAIAAAFVALQPITPGVVAEISKGHQYVDELRCTQRRQVREDEVGQILHEGRTQQ